MRRKMIQRTIAVVLLGLLISCASKETRYPSSVESKFPSELPFLASSFNAADLDGDGATDLIFLSFGTKFETLLNVAWGNNETKKSWAQVSTWTISPAADPATQNPVPPSVRDISSHLVAVLDVDGDGQLDLAMGQGIARNRGSRTFDFKAFAPQLEPGMHSCASAKHPQSGLLGVIRAAGTRLEFCSPLTLVCSEMPLGNISPEDIGDLAVGDFDKDGKDDVVASWWTYDLKGVNGAYLRSSQNWGNALPLKPITSADLQMGDIDGDKYPELVAQVPATISDFPSKTTIYQSSTEGFSPYQRLSNAQNHSDKSSLVDVDDDGRLDYLQIGVDEPSIALRKGDGKYLGKHTGTGATIETDVGWDLISAPAGGVGIQCLKILPGEKCYFFLRSSDYSGEKPRPVVYVLPQ